MFLGLGAVVFTKLKLHKELIKPCEILVCVLFGMCGEFPSLISNRFLPVCTFRRILQIFYMPSYIFVFYLENVSWLTHTLGMASLFAIPAILSFASQVIFSLLSLSASYLCDWFESSVFQLPMWVSWSYHTWAVFTPFSFAELPKNILPKQPPSCLKTTRVYDFFSC